MHVAGIVATLTGSPATRAALTAPLERMPGLTIGPHREGRLALVLETATLAEQRRRWQELLALDGIEMLALAYAHCLDDSDVDPAAAKEETP